MTAIAFLLFVFIVVGVAFTLATSAYKLFRIYRRRSR